MNTTAKRLLGFLFSFSFWITTGVAADWPAYKHDVRRSSVTEEMLAFPLAPIWTYNCPQPPSPAWPDPFRLVNRMDFDYAPHPVTAQGIVCFGSSADDTVRTLDAKTGEEKWHFITGGPVRFAPQIEKGKVYFAADDGMIYCLDAVSGKLVWKFQAAPNDERLMGNHRMISRWPVRTGVLVAEDVVYAVAGMWPAEGNFIYALAADTGKVLWLKDTCGGTPQGALLAGGDALLVPMGHGGPLPLDRRTGAPLRWESFGAGNGGTWLTIAGDKVYSFGMHRSMVLGIRPYSLANGAAGRGWGAGDVPQLTIEPRWNPDKTHATGKVSAIVDKGKLHARHAYGMALAGNTLLLGYDGTVTAEKSDPVTSAELRFGVAGDDLVVSARVAEKNITQGAIPWKGSCVEIFGSTPGKALIGQIFLVPGTTNAPARACRTQDGKPVPVPEVRLLTVPTSTGYEVAALIPLPLLALDKTSKQFMLETQVTVNGPDGTFQRDTLFGSPSAYQDSQKFGKLAVKRLAALPALDQIKKTLAAEKPLAIKMRSTAELWRAPVEGEAREIAVADGRVFVSTAQGVIHCFAPGTEKAGTTSHESRITSPETGNRKMETAVTSQNPASEILNRLREAGMDRGVALVLGDADGQLSTALAANTPLHVINALTDETQVAKLRENLLATTKWYGSRIQVQTVPRLDALPFPQYFANAVIVTDLPAVASAKADATPGLSGKDLYRLLHPCGGILLFAGLKPAETEALVKETGASEKEIQRSGDNLSVVRGKLEGALDWDTAFKIDQRVRWPLRLLWFGGPSTRQVQNYSQGAPGPVVANGRYFMFSERALTAVDAYNGAVLWSRPIPKAVPNVRDVGGVLFPVSDPTAYGKPDLARHLRVNDESVNLVLGKAYFQGKGEGTIQLDARTGAQKKIYGTFNPPAPVPFKAPQTWPLEMDANQSGAVVMESTPRDLVLTLTTKDPRVTKQDAWELFFDFRPVAARYGLYEHGAFHIRITPAQDEKTPASMSLLTGPDHPKLDLSGAVATTGTKTTVTLPWAEIEKWIGVKPASFDFAATLNAHDGGRESPIVRRHLFGNWAADGINNGWARIILDDSATTTGSVVAEAIMAGAKDAKAPLGGGAPGARAIDKSVQEAPGIHPLTGEPVPKVSGIAPVCGAGYCSATLISEHGSIYDLADNSGRHPLQGPKTGCTTPQLAALGMLIVSEEHGHCVCNYPLRTSLALAPAERRLNEDWSQFYDRDVDTRVRQAYLNLGAGGDRRDGKGDLWLGFPRNSELQTPDDFPNPDHPLPYPVGMRDAQTGLWYRRAIRPSIAVPLEVETLDPPSGAARAGQPAEPSGRDDADKPETEELGHHPVPNRHNLGSPSAVPQTGGFGPYRFNTDRVQIQGTDRPWIYGSGYCGIRKATLKLNFFKPLVALPATVAPIIDGKLDETVWGEELQSTNAVPLLPYTGTRVAFRHDSQNLYVGLQRPPMTAVTRGERTGSIASFKREPRPWQVKDSKTDAVTGKDNWWRLIVSPAFVETTAGRGDEGRRAAHFTVTPNGIRAEALYDGGRTNLDLTWNPVWQTAVQTNAQGWTLEMAIPWQTLAAAGVETNHLAVNFLMNDPGLGTEALTYLGIGGYNRCSNFTPLGLNQPAAVPSRQHTVRLHFAEPDAGVKAGQRVFDVKLQGQTVLKDFDVVKEAGGAHKAVVKEFQHIPAPESLVLEFAPQGAPTVSSAPILSGMEVVEEGFTPPIAASKDEPRGEK